MRRKFFFGLQSSADRGLWEQTGQESGSDAWPEGGQREHATMGKVR